MNPCYADWVDNSVAKLTKSFEKKTIWGEYFMDDETWGYKVCADNHERNTSVIGKSIKKLCQPSVDR